ncbi:hypothetical protein AB9P05_23915 [Roseivirga sp. BDSF3-8]|uniref:hypothetical protein n=1 Tax=Roseivirga sp. BDSF3-8 TaxID=3241598 RepID=UPI003531A6FD
MLKSSTHLKKAALMLLGLAVFTACNTGTGSTDTPLEPGPEVWPGMPGITVPTFTADIPHDVNPATQEALKNAGEIDSLNVVFNIYSWQAFAAINWPVDAQGNPQPSITSEGLPAWTTWKEYYEVYQENGEAPEPWGSARDTDGLPAELLTLPQAAADKGRNVRIAHLTSAVDHPGNVANEETQAFTGPVWDQNGNVLYYEILMNEEEFDYVVDNKLYNVNGQVEWIKNNPGKNLDFTEGVYGGDTEGAIEVKLAWKVMMPEDISERYLTMESWVHDTIGNDDRWKQVTLGLVGMHISQKTATASQWVWSTFEHIDLLEENSTIVNGTEQNIHPILTDPTCEICPVNVLISSEAAKKAYDTTYYQESSVLKTQAKRMIDIPRRVEKVNRAMQAYFATQNSPWQYFRLVDTQYPLDQSVPPADPNNIPEGVLNKPGGDPNIAFLTNMSMETFFQKGNQQAQNLTEGGSSTIVIYGTESCMGCHSSAGMYKSLDMKETTGQLSADFSWLLLKAHLLDSKETNK